MISFTVPGKAVPAVRMTQRGKFVKDSAKRYMAYKTLVGYCCKIKSPTSEPVSVALKFFVKGKVYGDIDNLSKAILDGCNRIAWEDDKQVYKLYAERIEVKTKEEERTEVTIKIA